MKKVAIIGTGGVARHHIDAIRSQSQRVQLVAAVDVDADRVNAFCADNDIPHAYTDTTTMLEKHQPDVVNICSPPFTHLSLSTECMEAGAWVYCEKPLVGSLAEFDQLTAAEERTGNHTASVFQLRFGAPARHLKKLLNDGTLGKPLVGVAHTLWYRSADYYAAPWRGKWETETGGTTMTHGIHTIDMLLSILGDWQEVRAKWTTLDRDIEVDNVAMAIATMQNGMMLSVVNSALSPRQETYVRLDFQKATIEATYLYSYMHDNWVFSEGELIQHQNDVKTWAEVEGEDLPTWEVQYRRFLDSMEKNERPEVSGDDVRRTLEFATALYKSSHTAQPVERGSITPDDPFYYSLSGG